jgi:hypothetical protein
VRAQTLLRTSFLQGQTAAAASSQQLSTVYLLLAAAKPSLSSKPMNSNNSLTVAKAGTTQMTGNLTCRHFTQQIALNAILSSGRCSKQAAALRPAAPQPARQTVLTGGGLQAVVAAGLARSRVAGASQSVVLPLTLTLTRDGT